MRDRLLTPEEAADRLAIKPRTIREWLMDGKLRGIKPGGKLWRVKESDLEAFLRG